MKTTAYTLALAATLMITLISDLGATNFKNNEESSINDIPFNTEVVANNALDNKLLAFDFTDEEYISDIPFNTEMIADRLNEVPDFTSENYINDIPFDTESIAANALYKEAVSVEFDMNEETYIDDIPFNTATIAEMRDSFASR